MTNFAPPDAHQGTGGRWPPPKTAKTDSIETHQFAIEAWGTEHCSRGFGMRRRTSASAEDRAGAPPRPRSRGGRGKEGVAAAFIIEMWIGMLIRSNDDEASLFQHLVEVAHASVRRRYGRDASAERPGRCQTGLCLNHEYGFHNCPFTKHFIRMRTTCLPTPPPRRTVTRFKSATASRRDLAGKMLSL